MLAPDSPESDAEDALTAPDQVDDLVVRGELIDRDAVAHQCDLGQVLRRRGRVSGWIAVRICCSEMPALIKLLITLSIKMSRKL